MRTIAPPGSLPRTAKPAVTLLCHPVSSPQVSARAVYVQVYEAVATSGAAVFGAMRDVALLQCDMDTHARQVTFRHLCGMSHLYSLRITYPIGGNLSYFPRISELQSVRSPPTPPSPRGRQAQS